MKILAVSDVQSQSLESALENSPKKFGEISCVVSCGDLESDYLSLIVDRVKRKLFFVSGNHVFRDESLSETDKEKMWRLDRDFKHRLRPFIAGYEDIHWRVEVFEDFILAGFGGSMWYNGRENQFTEAQMNEIVSSMIRKLSRIRFKEFILRRKKKDIIIISHAPIAGIHDLPDIPHRGFECFKKLIAKHQPVAWLHGHVDPTGNPGMQLTISGRTTVINVFGCKLIDISDGKVFIRSHCAEA